ncbi:hypothetical protein [Pedobacter sp. KBS0701]|uniref:hypothetical protein n=1 Tax=Pedobacter sp. KBS0701 TaxID=2578106 RepID=UPI00143D33C3|nr:hypothetical protein [Pedobacter sp. KBS0701]
MPSLKRSASNDINNWNSQPRGILPPPIIPNLKNDNSSGEDKEPQSASESETTPRGTPGKLEKSPTGKGTVPASQRAKPRVPSVNQKEKEWKESDKKCANCGNETPLKDVRAHHYPVRHADGGTKTVPACETCHTKYLHKKK